MRWLWLVAFVLFAGCNPAVRCKASTECGGGVCSGGFCTDLSAQPAGDGGPAGRGDIGELVDQDGPDSGVAPDAGVTNDDAGTNGRGP